jgi:hypothetical protein
MNNPGNAMNENETIPARLRRLALTHVEVARHPEDLLVNRTFHEQTASELYLCADLLEQVGVELAKNLIRELVRESKI